MADWWSIRLDVYQPGMPEPANHLPDGPPIHFHPVINGNINTN